MNIEFPDVYGVNTNKKGVKYLYNVYSGEVIAKVCTRCGEWHFLDDYNKAGKGFAGTHSLCRVCHSENGVNYRNNKEIEEDFQRLAEINRDEIIWKAIEQQEKAMNSPVFWYE